MVRGHRHSEIRMIQDIKKFRPELHVEILRDSFDVIILKHRNIQVRRSWSNQNVAAGITHQIEALQKAGIAHGVVAIGVVEV